MHKLLTRQANGSEYFEPAVIADSFIAGLRGCAIQKDDHQWRLDPGTIVKIERGPFAEMTGTIASWSGADRVRLLVWMLGRETVVEVRPADISALALSAWLPPLSGRPAVPSRANRCKGFG